MGYRKFKLIGKTTHTHTHTLNEEVTIPMLSETFFLFKIVIFLV